MRIRLTKSFNVFYKDGEDRGKGGAGVEDVDGTDSVVLVGEKKEEESDELHFNWFYFWKYYKVKANSL